jgi:hypothetical protein
MPELTLPVHVRMLEVNDTVVLLDRRSNGLVKLNPLGGRCLTLLTTGERDAAVAAICAGTGCEPEGARSSLERFVDRLRSAGLVEVNTDPGGDDAGAPG